MSKEVSVVFDVGRFMRKGFIANLESFKFQGADIRWLESKGFIQSKITVAGHPEHIQQLIDWCNGRYDN